MHGNCGLLPDHMVCKVTQRNNIRRADTCDPALKLLSEEITFDIQKHKHNLWKEHLDAHWYHRHTTHILWKTIQGLSGISTHTKHSHGIQQQNSNHTKTYCELFHQTIRKHAAHKTDRYTNRTPHKVQGYSITLTITQVQEAIKQSINNNSQGPDKLNIRHLRHIGPIGLAFLTSMLKTALNTNIIPHIWKFVNIVPIPKLNKDIDKGTSYRPISLFSVIAKTLEKSLLHYITANMPSTPTQHGCKAQHSTVTELHTVYNTVAEGFKPGGSPCANDHCGTRCEQSFWHYRHTHTCRKAAADQDSRHNHWVYRRLH